MADRAFIGAGMAGVVLAAVCCVAPLFVAALPLAGVGTWLAGAGLVMFAPVVAGLVLVAWSLCHRRTKAVGCEMKNQKECVKL